VGAPHGGDQVLDRLSRYAPFTGIVFVIVFLVGVFSGNSSPNGNATGAKVIAFYAKHKSGQETGDLVGGIGLVFFLFFVAALYGYLRRAPAARTLSLLGLIGAALFTTGFVLFAGIDYALAYGSHSLSPDAAQALNLLDNELFLPLFVGAIVFGVGIGLAIVRSGLLPAWLGWAILVFGIAAGTPAFFIGIIGLAIWTLVTSVLIFQRSAGPPARSPGPAPATA
jgi:hypothetical protein